MIATLLRKNISKWQFAAYALACLVGLSILLVSLEFYFDVRSAAKSGASKSDYIVLSKPISLLSALGVGTSYDDGFSDAEIADIAAQPWAKRVGVFTSADFNISASVNFAGRGLSTALFFEALPDDFVDVDLSEFKFDPTGGEIPVVVPRDYLALYNFGFAASRGLPRLTEGVIRQVPLQISVSGNGRYDVFPARIVGLSSRLNTIAVPDDFMTWANGRYGDNTSSHTPARLIVELSSSGNPAIEKWLKTNNIDSSGDAVLSDSTVYIATIAASVVAAIGAVIAVLSVLILLLSLFLLVQKNSDKICDLTLLGYTRRRVAWFYYRLIIFLNTVITIGAVCVALFVSQFWKRELADFGITGDSVFIVIAAAVIIMTAVSAVSLYSCSIMVNRASR